MAEGNLIAFPELFESALSLLDGKDKDLSFLSVLSCETAHRFDGALVQCQAVDFPRSQKESVAFRVSEETRRAISQIETYKRQPGVAPPK